MIFGDGYDKSLWLMMKCDKNNRKIISDFIKNIPDDFYLKIRENISIIDYYKKSNVLFDNRNMSCEYEKDNRLYYFKFDPYNMGLTLGYSVINGDKYIDEFEMILYSFDEFIDKGVLNVVGIIHPYRNSFESGDSRRLLINNSIFMSNVNFKFFSLESSFREVISVKLLNMNSIPLNMDINDINKNKLLIKKKDML